MNQLSDNDIKLQEIENQMNDIIYNINNQLYDDGYELDNLHNELNYLEREYNNQFNLMLSCYENKNII